MAVNQIEVTPRATQTRKNKSFNIPLLIFILLIIIAVVLTLLLTGVFGGKPQGMSNEAYELGIKALDAVDDYIDINMTASDCVETLDRISIRLDDLHDSEDLLTSTDTLLLSIDVSGARFAVYMDSLGDDELTDVLESRNKLAERLNKGER